MDVIKSDPKNMKYNSMKYKYKMNSETVDPPKLILNEKKS